MSEDGDGFRSIITGSGVVFGGIVLELLISLVGKILIARYLGKVDYGGVALGVTVLVMTSTVVLAGIHTGAGRYLPRFDDPTDRNGLIWGALAVVGGLSLLAAAVVASAAGWIASVVFDDPGLSDLLVVIAIALPASALMRLAIGITQGYQLSLPKVVVRNLTFPLTRLLGFAAVIVVGAGSIGVAGAYVAAYLIAACVGLWYVYKLTDISPSVPGDTHVRELVSFSAPLFLTGVLSLVLSDVDTLMLGALSTQADVGIYNVVYPTAILLLIFLRSFRFLYMPRISELDEADQRAAIRSNYDLITKWLYFTTTPVLVLFVVRSEWIITLLYGAEYAPGSRALVILALGFYFHSVLGLNGTTLTSLGWTRAILAVNIVAAVANIVLNLYLIPRYSLIGAAVATTLSYVLINALYSSVLYVRTGIVPARRPILLLSVMISPIAFAVYRLSQGSGEFVSWVSFLVFVVAYTALFVRIVGVSDEAKDIISDVVRRYRTG